MAGTVPQSGHHPERGTAPYPRKDPETEVYRSGWGGETGSGDCG